MLHHQRLTIDLWTARERESGCRLSLQVAVGAAAAMVCLTCTKLNHLGKEGKLAYLPNTLLLLWRDDDKRKPLLPDVLALPP